jgi:hypothetical protein
MRRPLSLAVVAIASSLATVILLVKCSPGIAHLGTDGGSSIADAHGDTGTGPAFKTYTANCAGTSAVISVPGLDLNNPPPMHASWCGQSDAFPGTRCHQTLWATTDSGVSVPCVDGGTATLVIWSTP